MKPHQLFLEIAKLLSIFTLVFSSYAFSQSLCAAGSFGADGSDVCTPAAPGSFVPNAGATFALLSPPGFYVPIAGAISPTIAPAGSYVPAAGAIAPIPAAPGSYVPSEGQTSAFIAQPGFFVASAGASSQTIAPAGSFVQNAGAASATLAAAGSYVPNAGQTSAIAAQPGFFVPIAGATSQTIAPAGSFVQNSGATQATLALAGTYVPNEGQTSALLSPPGFFVADNGATEATIAPVGFFVQGSGATSAIPAAPGFYAPEEGATLTLLCPQDSTSFGAAPACRSGFISMNNPDTIGPNFDSNFGDGLGDGMGGASVINLGALETNNMGAFEFEIFNSANFLGMTSDLTSLSLLDAQFSGANADLFSLVGFMPATVLGEQESTNFNISFLSLIETAFSVDLTFSTDQFASFGDPGQNFVFTLTGRFFDGQVQVSGPNLWLTFIALMGLLVARRRVLLNHRPFPK